MKIKLTFLENHELDSRRDGSMYSFFFNVIDEAFIGAPEEEIETNKIIATVFISGTLEAAWLARDPKIDFPKVCFEYSKREIIQKYKDGFNSRKYSIELNSGNSPERCPYNSHRIIMEKGVSTSFEVGSKLMDDVFLLELATSIIDLRDSINSIMKEKFKKKLLLYSEERDILQLFRTANTKEDFVYRISSLKLLATNINSEFLIEATSGSIEKSKSIDLLELFLKENYEHCEDIIRTLRSINRLRQLYPIHGDSTDGVHKAHNFFGISYPISSYSNAWRMILQSYSNSLLRLLEIIRSK